MQESFRHNARVPKVVSVSRADTPMSVETATRAFGSAIRVHLIRYYLAAPASQSQAAEALGVTMRAASVNTKVLHEAGVLVEEPSPADRRFVIYRVDTARLAELERALHRFLRGQK